MGRTDGRKLSGKDNTRLIQRVPQFTGVDLPGCGFLSYTENRRGAGCLSRHEGSRYETSQILSPVICADTPTGDEKTSMSRGTSDR